MKRSDFYALVMLIVFLSACAEPSKRGHPVVHTMDSPAGSGSSLPFLFSDGEKTLLSWVEKEGDTLATLRYAALREGAWQQPKDILQGGDWFVNWADFPVIAENRGNLLTHILKKSSGDTYAYDIKLNVLPGDEKTWKTNLALHTDGTPTEHGFVTALPYRDGFFVTWLDGRNTMEDEDGNRGAMTIRAAEVAAMGAIKNEAVLDERVCDCCQTTAAITASGPVVIYRDRSEGEVRDMSIVRQVNGEWSAPETICNDGWKIKGCPVNGPGAAVMNNSLAVAWFTAANDAPMVKLAFSEDGGAHFDAPIRIDGGHAGTMGRVDVALLNQDTAVVSWMEGEGGHARISAVKVSRSGDLSDYLQIADLSASRGTGFPQMEIVGDRVYFAWTDVANDGSAVKTAYVLVDRF